MTTLQTILAVVVLIQIVLTVIWFELRAIRLELVKHNAREAFRE